jgi:chitinase
MMFKTTIRNISAAALVLLLFQQAASADKLVVGYYPSWNKSTLPHTAVLCQNLTHIVYAFLIPAADGSISVPGGFLYPELNQAAHQKGVKVVISLGGWGQSDGFSPMAADTAARHKFVQNITTFCTTNDYDGVDIDWEYPTTSADRANLTALIHELRLSFNNANPAFSISMAVPATGWSGQWFDVTAMKNDFDWIGIMTYDFYGTWTATSGPNAPLYGKLSTNPDGWIDYSVGYYTATRGVPSAKVLIGTPFYGWMYTASTMYGTSTGASQLAYSSIAPKLTQGWTRSWDSLGQVPYMINAAKTQVISYDDSESVALKCDYIKTKGLGGTIIWAIGQDLLGGKQPLLDVIGASLRSPTRVQLRSQEIPASMTLEQNYPNPFNGQTIIRYSVASAGRVTLKLFDVLGRVVQTLVDGEQTQGVHEVSVSTNSLTSGVYMYRIQFQNASLTRSMIVLR